MTLVERYVSPDLSGLTLDELARIARSEHRQMMDAVDRVTQALSEGLLHAIAVGDALNAARELVDDRPWSEWCAEAVPDTSEAQRTRYCRWAFYKDKVFAAATPLDTNSVVAYLRGLPPVNASPSIGDEKIAEAIRLRSAGMTCAEIAALLEVSTSTVYNYTTPGQREKVRARQNKRTGRVRKEIRAGRRLLERQERDAAAKRVGGRVDKAYSLIRQACAEIDGAMADLESGRDDLRMALSAAHKAEDHISAAIRKAA